MWQSNSSNAIYQAYWKVKTRFETLCPEPGCKVLTVTSVEAGEGKSSTAVNLAAAYAENGKRVLLVDANLRNPSVHKLLGLSNRSGLTNLLFDQAASETLVRTTGMNNLDAITSGPATDNPVGLLATGRMTAVTDGQRPNYDLIILDSPAAAIKTDAHILASLSDGVLLVVKQGRVKQEKLRKVTGELGRINATIVGVLMNQVNLKTAQ